MLVKLFIIFVICLSYSATLYATSSTCGKSYQLTTIANNSIALDGLAEDPAWAKANIISDFSLPWKESQAQKTRFMALIDDSHLYFHFSSTDSSVALKKHWQGEETVVLEDRVEIFFSKDLTLNSYFALEIDAAGRVLDYHSTFYRQFDPQWHFTDLLLSAVNTVNGYSIEGSISLKSLALLSIPPFNALQPVYVGLFRADLKNTPEKQRAEWISWINPDTATPDFHVASAFGCFFLAAH
ncbi:carbohydrate-binding family 9-like protein [Thalassotalea sp. ND16A]|uniref:carbohydrate-binding family 9-like protein n=1 Tax=Thalassotalea sp. ND16A TaxID=1535422 RepID=UPI00051DD9ED|nr:carbohydrate-binding family 9-like protein [Thalassotalea sp. ND16A]KGJ92108.1 hypothetical protein ND16A_1769 [Thalassotalea sp. ND16A]